MSWIYLTFWLICAQIYSCLLKYKQAYINMGTLNQEVVVEFSDDGLPWENVGKD